MATRAGFIKVGLGGQKWGERLDSGHNYNLGEDLCWVAKTATIKLDVDSVQHSKEFPSWWWYRIHTDAHNNELSLKAHSLYRCVWLSELYEHQRGVGNGGGGGRVLSWLLSQWYTKGRSLGTPWVRPFTLTLMPHKHYHFYYAWYFKNRFEAFSQ